MTPPPAPPTGTVRRPRLVAWAVVLAALAVLGVWLARRGGGPGADLDAAEQALRRHDPAAARARLDRCLARWPKEPRALLLAARAARQAGACADAERYLTAFEEADEPTPASRLEWVLLGAQQGDFAGQEDRLRRFVSEDPPEAPDVVEAMARGYAVSYRRPEALVSLDWLLGREPDHVPALLLRGTLQDGLRKTDAAEADFRRAVELAPESGPAHAGLAAVLQHLGRNREAIYHGELALRYRPGDPATLLGLARALGDAADLDGAQRRLDELLAAEPDSPDGLVERGRVELRRGRPAEAEPFLDRAVHAAPWHRTAWRLRLLALNEQGHKEAAAGCESRLGELTAEDGVAGRLRLRARDHPEDAGVRWELWQWCQRNGQAEEGFAWLTEVVRLNPQYAPAQAALADHFERAGQPRRAALHRAAAGQGRDAGTGG